MADLGIRIADLVGFGDRWRSWAAHRAKPTRVGDLVVGRRARIDGIVGAEGDLFRSPFTRRACVFWSVAVTERYVPGSTSGFAGDTEPAWRSLFTASSSAPFAIVDDAGARALVDPSWVVLALRFDDVSESPIINDDDPEYGAFMRKNGVPTTKYMGITGDHVFHELVIPPAVRLCAWGKIHEAASVAAQGYRGGPVSIKRIAGSAMDRIVLLAR